MRLILILMATALAVSAQQVVSPACPPGMKCNADGSIVAGKACFMRRPSNHDF